MDELTSILLNIFMSPDNNTEINEYVLPRIDEAVEKLKEYIEREKQKVYDDCYEGWY